MTVSPTRRVRISTSDNLHGAAASATRLRPPASEGTQRADCDRGYTQNCFEDELSRAIAHEHTLKFVNVAPAVARTHVGDARQRRIERLGLAASGLREISASAALAAHLGRHCTD